MSCRYYFVDPQPLKSLLESITSIGLEAHYKADGNIQIFDPVHKDRVWICGSDDELVDSVMRFYPSDGHVMHVLERDLGLRSITEYMLYDYLNTRIGPREFDATNIGNDPYLDVIDDRDELSFKEIWDMEYGHGVEERVHCPLKFLQKREQS